MRRVSTSPRTILFWLLPLIMLVTLGCSGGGDMDAVSGTVTLDDQPLENALVVFTPSNGQGSSSMGRTDSRGYYELSFSRDLEGAIAGEHTVSISTYSGGDLDAEPPEPGTPEKVPAKYNIQSELTRTVEEGGSTIDFDLKSDGQIISPDQLPNE